MHGLQEDIVVHEGKILDGRHRYLACLARQVAPRFRDYAGECGSPLDFVVARNCCRRHLTESQPFWQPGSSRCSRKRPGSDKSRD
ncbi:MAG TPA: hypothetical protein VKI17_01175 [Gemmataceae bacterium]|nr:hypothetical protein [Gemmataceae bacterium]